MINLSQIYEGWKNNLFPPSELKEVIEKTSQDRLSICSECPHHSKFHKTARPDAHCTHCGCTLAAKTKCLSCSCPIKKWTPLLTVEQENEMRTTKEDTLKGYAREIKPESSDS